jgi:hypothetical protein
MRRVVTAVTILFLSVSVTDTVHRLVGNMVISGTTATVTTFPLQSVLPAGQAAIDLVNGITVGPDNALMAGFWAL